MIDVRIGKIKVRRGKDLQRKLVNFEEGELLYTTDTKRTFIGDGETLGGNIISNVNFVTPIEKVPTNAVYGDIVYVEPINKTFIVGYNPTNQNELQLFLIGGFYDDLGRGINNLLNKIRPLTGCLLTKDTTPTTPTTPIASLEWVIEPVDKTYDNNVIINATFTAKAKGPYEDIFYTWEKADESVTNWSIVPKAIGDTLTILDAKQKDIGYYRCVATSNAGVIYSKNAKLDINNIEFKWILQPLSYSTQLGSPAYFTAEASNTFNGPITYQWYRNDVMIPAANNQTYSISRTFNSDIGKYKCVATTTYNGSTKIITSIIVELKLGTNYILGSPTVYIVSRAGEYIKWS